MSYHIKRVERGYAVVDDEGKPLPFQVETQLLSKADEPPVFKVTFLAGKLGLQVIDERDE